MQLLTPEREMLVLIFRQVFIYRYTLPIFPGTCGSIPNQDTLHVRRGQHESANRAYYTQFLNRLQGRKSNDLITIRR